MSEKLPWMQFFKSDWKTDPALCLCSPEARGVWMDLLIAMHDSGRSGKLCGTTDQLARLARSSTAEFVRAMTELQTTGAAEVSERNGVYQIGNRRMMREASSRESTRKRVEKHRKRGSNADETGQKVEGLPQKGIHRRITTTPTTRDGGVPAENPEHEEPELPWWIHEILAKQRRGEDLTQPEIAWLHAAESGQDLPAARPIQART